MTARRQHGHGHHWKEPERVRDYAARMDRREAERREQFGLMARLIPFERDAAIHILDIGAGYGAVAASLLDTYPRATALLLDVSEEMIRLGRARMEPYGDRVRYVHADFADGSLPAGADGPFHAAVSSLAIHHLPPLEKHRLYTEIFRRLEPGGSFLNLDLVEPATPELAAFFRALDAADRAARGEDPPPACSHRSEMQPLDDHLTWLRNAGFVHADCYWRRLDLALFGGYREPVDWPTPR